MPKVPVLTTIAATVLTVSAVVGVEASATASGPRSTRAVQGRAWVLNAASVSPIDTDTYRAGKALKLRCQSPSTMAITPDGRTVYVTCAHSVIQIDAATGRAGSAIRVGTGVEGIIDQMVITPDGNTGYVAVGNTVVPINILTKKAGKPIVVAGQQEGPLKLAVTPNGRKVYAVNATTVVPITTASNKVGSPIYTGPTSAGMVITPDGKTAYVLGALNTVIPISTMTNTTGNPIIVGTRSADSWALAAAPNGKTIYVVNFGTRTIVPITTATNMVGRPIKMRSNPISITITPNGQTAYVAAGSRYLPD